MTDRLFEVGEYELPAPQPPAKRPRPRDEVWDEMERLFGRVAEGTNAHHRRNKAVKDLKLLGASATDLPRALSSFYAAFPQVTCTDIALATHFPSFRPKKIEPPCQECGCGQGMHASDCRYVTSSDGADRITF